MKPIKIIPSGPLEVNTFVVPLKDDYVFVVDPAEYMTDDDNSELINYIQSNNLKPVAVILTHGHFDHVFGLKKLCKKFPDIIVAVHKDDKDCIGASSKIMQSRFLYDMGLETFLPAVSNLPEATVIFDNTLNDIKTLYDYISLDTSLNEALSSWNVIHTPGHSAGSICLYKKEFNVLFSGDTVFYHSYGRTDLYGGSEKVLRTSLKYIYKNIPDDTLIYPGHGPCEFRLSKNY